MFFPSKRRFLLAISGLTIAAQLPASDLDPYGGWKDVQGKPTGWFHLEKVNDRDILMTPDGHAFLPLGVNHISAIRDHGKNEPDLFSEAYGADWEVFAEQTGKQLHEWGFNATGGSVAKLNQSMPYFAATTFAKTAKYFSSPEGKNPYEFPDVFDPEVKRSLEAQVEAFCNRHRDNRNLIAYYWTDTPTWDIQKTRIFRNTDWVSEIRSLPADTPGRRAYALFLQNRYAHQLDRLNRAYALNLSTFGQLISIDLQSLDLNRYEISRDDEAFLGVIAETYYKIIGEAMQDADPNHMIFGEKYLLGDLPPQVLKAALPYVDALAIQPGDGYLPIYTPGDTFPRAELEELNAVSGLPIIICDHQVSFATPRYPTSIWPFHQRINEADAAQATIQFLEEAFMHPFIIGYMRCQYIDRYSERRSASKLGLLRDDGTPYNQLLEAHIKGYSSAKKAVMDTLGK